MTKIEFIQDFTRFNPLEPKAEHKHFKENMVSSFGSRSFTANLIWELEVALLLGYQRLSYISSNAKTKNGENAIHWIRREHAVILADAFKDYKIHEFELIYSTWEDGAFSDFVYGIQKGKSKVNKFVLSCHTGDDFTVEHARCLADLANAWAVETLEIHNMDFQVKTLDELAIRLNDIKNETISKFILCGHRKAGGRRDRFKHSDLEEIAKRNKK